MAKADLLTVKSGLDDERVALWEVHPDHPEGEVYIAGELVVQVARTAEVERHLRSGDLVEVAAESSRKSNQA